MTAPVVGNRGRLARAGRSIGRVGGRVGGQLMGGTGATRVATKAVILAVTALVGFLLVGQVRTSHRVTRQLSAEREGDLARILSDLNTASDNLRDQVGTLKLQLFSLQSSTRSDTTAAATAAAQLDALRVLAGTVAATGPGISVVVDDPEFAVHYDQLINLIEELRDAGAEAIAVNGERVGATSAFASAGRGILLSGPGAAPSRLSPPYRVTAIGDPATLDTALNIPGGALDALRAQRGVQAAVLRAATVEVPALAGPPTFRAARPVGSGA
jgi:uncharacterized protein YlxW (UPF0749 family)